MTLDCNHPNLDVQKRLEAIYNLNPKKMNFRLDSGPYIDLLKKLGNPYLNLPPVIHVAGTNGKGSTIAFLKSLYEADGKTVHAYNSPHLITFNERITLSGRHIDDDRLIKYLDLIEITNDGAPLTFFEYTTALALKAFADHSADVLLLETGLGGRLDCTNVIPNPIATIITSIGYDHMDWLGANIETIAGEKAGIMKPNAPCFIAPQKYNVNHVFEAKAKQVGCDIHFVERSNDLPELGLIGEHQRDNASTALTVIASDSEAIQGLQTHNYLGLLRPYSPRNDKIKNALSNTYWPARMEKISDTPEIWFDCGHNKDGAHVIAQQMQKWKSANPKRPIHLIVGLAGDKNPNDFINPMAPYIDSITCIDLLNARNPQSGNDLASKLTTDLSITTQNTIAQAIETIDNNNGIIFITGSLYLYEQIKD